MTINVTLDGSQNIANETGSTGAMRALHAGGRYSDPGFDYPDQPPSAVKLYETDHEKALKAFHDMLADPQYRIPSLRNKATSSTDIDSDIFYPQEVVQKDSPNSRSWQVLSNYLTENGIIPTFSSSTAPLSSTTSSFDTSTNLESATSNVLRDLPDKPAEFKPLIPALTELAPQSNDIVRFGTMPVHRNLADPLSAQLQQPIAYQIGQARLPSYLDGVEGYGAPGNEGGPLPKGPTLRDFWPLPENQTKQSNLLHIYKETASLPSFVIATSSVSDAATLIAKPIQSAIEKIGATPVGDTTVSDITENTINTVKGITGAALISSLALGMADIAINGLTITYNSPAFKDLHSLPAGSNSVTASTPHLNMAATIYQIGPNSRLIPYPIDANGPFPRATVNIQPDSSTEAKVVTTVLQEGAPGIPYSGGEVGMRFSIGGADARLYESVALALNSLIGNPILISTSRDKDGKQSWAFRQFAYWTPAFLSEVHSIVLGPVQLGERSFFGSNQLARISTNQQDLVESEPVASHMAIGGPIGETAYNVPIVFPNAAFDGEVNPIKWIFDQPFLDPTKPLPKTK